MSQMLTVQFRSMDMRLTVRDLQDVDELVEPEELKTYLDQLLRLLVYLFLTILTALTSCQPQFYG
jgi:hypothetical protein